MVVRVSDDGEVHSITAAPRSHSEEMDARVRRYVISMSIRTVCVVLVLVIDHPVRWVFAIGAVLLPYVAVVMANAGRGRRATLDPVPRDTSRLALNPAPTPFPAPVATPVPTPVPTPRDRADG